jgi:SAM-dependent methyltransferase
MRKFKWKVVKTLGLETLVWNAEWASGRWDYLDSMKQDSLEIVRKYARNGRIVELGCGSGGLIDQVGVSYFSHYQGFDISRSAVRRARARNLERCEFQVGKMQEAAFGVADLIIVQEALFYLEESEQHALINKCVGRLSPGGAFYVTVHDASQFAPLIAAVRQSGKVMEERFVKADSNEFVHLVVSPERA